MTAVGRGRAEPGGDRRPPAHRARPRAQAAAGRRRRRAVRRQRLRGHADRGHLRRGRRRQGPLLLVLPDQAGAVRRARARRCASACARPRRQAMDPAADPLTPVRQGTEASVRFHAEHAGYFALLDVERADATHAELLREGSDVYLADVVALVGRPRPPASSADEPAEALAVGVVGAVSSFTHAWRDRPPRPWTPTTSPRSSAPGSSGPLADVLTLAAPVGGSARRRRPYRRHDARRAAAVASSRRRRSRRSARCSSSPRSACWRCSSSGCSCGWCGTCPFWWFAGGYVAARRAAVHPARAGARAHAAVRRPPADRDELARIEPLWRDIAVANRLPARPVHPAACCRPTSSTPSPAAATSSSSRRSPSTSCPAASWPACSPTS